MGKAAVFRLVVLGLASISRISKGGVGDSEVESCAEWRRRLPSSVTCHSRNWETASCWIGPGSGCAAGGGQRGRCQVVFHRRRCVRGVGLVLCAHVVVRKRACSTMLVKFDLHCVELKQKILIGSNKNANKFRMESTRMESILRIFIGHSQPAGDKPMYGNGSLSFIIVRLYSPVSQYQGFLVTNQPPILLQLARGHVW